MHSLGSPDVQKGKSLGIPGSLRRRVQHEMLVALGKTQRIAINRDLADDRMPERLREHLRGLHVMSCPQPGEIGAVVAEIRADGGIADAVTLDLAGWLLSDRASMVTGAIVPVDGGAGA